MIFKISSQTIAFQAKHTKNKSPEVLDTSDLAKRFKNEGLTLKDVKRMLKKFPKLGYYEAYQIEYNVREFVRLNKKDGVTIGDHLKLTKCSPSLLASKPETLTKHLNTLYDFFKDFGFSKKDIIDIENKSSGLRARSADNIIKQYKDIADYYKPYGLELAECVKKLFNVYTINTTFNKFKTQEEAVVAHFAKEGMNTNDFITTFKKQPSIVSTNIESILEKLELWKYIELNKLNDTSKELDNKALIQSMLRKNLSHSNEKNLLYLLICKLKTFYNIKINTKKIPEELSALLKKNPDKKYTINILEGKFVEDFIKVVTDFSQKAINKNVFKIIVKK